MPAIDRRLLTHFEWLLPLLVLAVATLGILTIYSATWTPATVGPPALAMRQLAWLGAGVVAMLLATSFDYRRLDHSAYLIYGLCLAALIAVPLVGTVAGGSRRWLRFGPIAVQPSEFMKLGMIVLLAHWFSRSERTHHNLLQVAPALLLVAVPAGLILMQPDLGSAALLTVVSLSMMLMAGVRMRWFVLLAMPLLAVAPFLWGFLKEYQQQRILMFLDPTKDPLGAGYHVIQSTIAVGSGMVWGKGWLKGTQNHLDFLPEEHTDFIFSVFAEERGFVGSCMLMLLYLAIMLRLVVIAVRARDRFGLLLVSGVLATILWQVMVNIGMTTGLLPVVGITLPFMSYGGSSLLCLLFGAGLAMNVSMRRFLF
ncbi:MAG TPA: rod shape-determining protein RodA [Candidatus Limnocylindria bacterium]|nr:rod shape-determining protein RodA [Candidatus Limnocylindria bacterium]